MEALGKEEMSEPLCKTTIESQIIAKRSLPFLRHWMGKSPSFIDRLLPTFLDKAKTKREL